MMSGFLFCREKYRYRYTDDVAGNLLAETNELGGETTYEHDTKNNVI